MKFIRQNLWQRLYVWLAAGLITFVYVSFAGSLFSFVENLHLDGLIRLAPHKQQESRVVLVDIDEKSLAEIGAWPWSRLQMAQLLDNLQKDYQVALIGLDIVFPEAKPQDELLKRALSSSNVVMSQVIDFAASAHSHAGQLADVRMSAQAPQASNQGTGYIGNSASVLSADSQVGNIGPIIDADGKVRRIFPFACVKEGCSLALSLRMYQALYGEGQFIADYPARRLIWQSMGDSKEIPLDNQGAMYIPFGVKRGAFLNVSAADVLARRIDPKLLKNCIIYIGSTALGIGDYVATALDAVTPGVEVHTQNMVALLDDQYIDSAQQEWLILIIILFSLGFMFWPGNYLVWASLAGMLLMFLVDVVSFNYFGCYLKFSPVYVQMIVSLILWAGVRNAFLNRQLLIVSNRFSRFLPERLVGNLIQGRLVNPGHENRLLTVLIADMRGFTSASEGKSPKEVAKLAQRCLEELTRCVYAHHGTIEKYSGDGLMALWGAPEPDSQHALHALQAGLDMQAAIDGLAEWFNENKFPKLSLSIGINSGEMAVGIFGGQSHMAWTAHGEAFNVASRIEQMTRVFDQDILLGNLTVRLIGLEYFNSMGSHRVKGLSYPVEIFNIKTDRRSQLSCLCR